MTKVASAQRHRGAVILCTERVRYSGRYRADIKSVVDLKNTADHPFRDYFVFSTLRAGRHEIRIVTASVLFGGSARVRA